MRATNPTTVTVISVGVNLYAVRAPDCLVVCFGNREQVHAWLANNGYRPDRYSDLHQLGGGYYRAA